MAGAIRTFRSHSVHVLDVVPMEAGMVEVSAQALAAGLERVGRVELQGIYFETRSATLTPAPGAALEQVRQLLGTQPQLRLSVVGPSHVEDAGAVHLALMRAEAGAASA